MLVAGQEISGCRCCRRARSFRGPQVGRFKWRRKSYFLSETLHHQEIGLDYRADGEFDLYFGPVHLGVLSEEQEKLRLIHQRNRSNPVNGKIKNLLPM